MPVFGVATIGGARRPVQLVERVDDHKLVVVPVDGHIGDGREVPQEITASQFEPCKDEEEAMKLA